MATCQLDDEPTSLKEKWMLNHFHPFQTRLCLEFQTTQNLTNNERNTQNKQSPLIIHPTKQTIAFWGYFPLMFSIDPENGPKPKRKGSSSNHHFSGSSC